MGVGPCMHRDNGGSIAFIGCVVKIELDSRNVELAGELSGNGVGLGTIRLPVVGAVGVEKLFNTIARFGSADGPDGKRS